MSSVRSRHPAPDPRRRGSLHRVGWRANLPSMVLSDRDRAILDFDRSWWTELRPKEAAIRDRLELSASRHYEILGVLIDAPEAIAYDPLLVRRLRRLRDRRRRARFEGRSVNERPGR